MLALYFYHDGTFQDDEAFIVQTNFSGGDDIFESIVPEQDLTGLDVREFMQDVVEELELRLRTIRVAILRNPLLATTGPL